MQPAQIELKLKMVKIHNQVHLTSSVRFATRKPNTDCAQQLYLIEYTIIIHERSTRSLNNLLHLNRMVNLCYANFLADAYVKVKLSSRNWVRLFTLECYGILVRVFFQFFSIKYKIKNAAQKVMKTEMLCYKYNLFSSLPQNGCE